ncbi:MAG: hypothetical protein HOM69_15240, partial [Gammaproteobacteria bacterium]|nr:hypothetical protein [Gammaproteobacteria bacterium]
MHYDQRRLEKLFTARSALINVRNQLITYCPSLIIMNSDHDMTYKKPTVPNHPFRRRMLVSSIAAALGTTSVGFSYGAEIEEVVVTARQ